MSNVFCTPSPSLPFSLPLPPSIIVSSTPLPRRDKVRNSGWALGSQGKLGNPCKTDLRMYKVFLFKLRNHLCKGSIPVNSFVTCTAHFFKLSRGVRQGCPLSPCLFILCAEILGSVVRNYKEAHGIMILGTECKISQYADDTTMILDGSQSSFSRTLYLFDAFGSVSSLKVNYDKTESL